MFSAFISKMEEAFALDNPLANPYMISTRNDNKIMIVPINPYLNFDCFNSLRAKTVLLIL